MQPDILSPYIPHRIWIHNNMKIFFALFGAKVPQEGLTIFSYYGIKETMLNWALNKFA